MPHYKIAIVGAGPAGYFAAQALQNSVTEDLTFTGDYLNARTFRSFEIYFTIALVYLAIVWLIKGIAYAVEKKYFEFAKYRR